MAPFLASLVGLLGIVGSQAFCGAAGDQAAAPGTPEVIAVEPPRATRGSQLTVKVTGKNFLKGVKASFSNPGIQVLETRARKSTELRVSIQVAPDAPAGATGLFIVNPDDTEAEASFEVTDGSPSRPASATEGGTASQPGSPPAPKSATPSPESPASKSAVSASQRFEVLNLGEVINIIQSQTGAKGTLILAGRSLKYEEAGKEVFSATRANVKEIGPNAFLGVSTGTFHIILNSGKTFNFIAASLRPPDSQAIVDSLRRALQ